MSGVFGILWGLLTAVIFSWIADYRAPVIMGSVLLSFFFSAGVCIVVGFWPV
jgi:hypothetical protein